jgi:tetratricopeptide (TPR) repeat protein
MAHSTQPVVIDLRSRRRRQVAVAERAPVDVAYDFYVRASEIDESPARHDEAAALYRRAIELNPNLALAYTNLANIRYRRGDVAEAHTLYLRAIEIDARQPEAHYNLGYLCLERGENWRAVLHLRRAVASRPDFADAHFNLGVAFERIGEPVPACAHWRRYLELEPTGAWAEIAMRHARLEGS